MKRVLLNFKEDELAQLDSVAKEMGESRAGAMRHAVRLLTVHKEKERSEAERRSRIDRALRDLGEIGKIAARDKAWDPAKIIRQYRDHDRLQQKRSALSVMENKAKYTSSKSSRGHRA